MAWLFSRLHNARRLFIHISSTVYSQVLNYTAEWTGVSGREQKRSGFEMATTLNWFPHNFAFETRLSWLRVPIMPHRCTTSTESQETTFHAGKHIDKSSYFRWAVILSPQFINQSQCGTRLNSTPSWEQVMPSMTYNWWIWWHMECMGGILVLWDLLYWFGCQRPRWMS